MSGLDESLSDVTPRKKYPFELEKAIHNVMFIQHHIQRQDEFNAVSFLQYFQKSRKTNNIEEPKSAESRRTENANTQKDTFNISVAFEDIVTNKIDVYV